MSSCGIVCGTGGWTGPRPGDPDNASVLSANGVYGGIAVSWTYPSTNSHAVAHALLYRNSSSDRDSALNIAVVAGNSYFDKQDAPTLCFYWIRIVSINGTTGDWIGPVSATSKTRAEGILEDLTGQISAGVLAVSLRQDIDKITLNYQDLLSEIRNRIAGDGALSLALEDLQAGVTQAMAFVHEEINTRIDGENALAQQVSVIAALNANNASAIINEATARVTADEAHTYQMNALYAATNTNAAAVITETNARTNADSALASQITTAQSTLGDQIASVQTGLQTNIDTVDGRVTSIGALYTAKVSVNGLVGGFGIYNNGHTVEAGFDVDRFWIGRTASDKVLPFIVDAGTVYINKARIRNADIDTLKIAGNAVTAASSGALHIPTNLQTTALSNAAYFSAPYESGITVLVVLTGRTGISSGGATTQRTTKLLMNGAAVFDPGYTQFSSDFFCGAVTVHIPAGESRAFELYVESRGEVTYGASAQICFFGAKR